MLNNFEIGGDRLTILAGPCAMESKEICAEVCGELKKITSKLGINYVFKVSFDKANRSSLNSYRGLGVKEGLKIIGEIKEEFKVPVVTDIHEPYQAELAADVADILQIPAFLCRQTDLIVAAAKTGKIINIKKGQFLSPHQIKSIAKKAEDSGNNKILITERGVSFGYNNLVSDMRAVKIIKDAGYPVIFDATHSVQIPGGKNDSSGGEKQFVPLLAKSAVAAGADGLFFEVHPNPSAALCDGDNMISLNETEKLFDTLNKIYKIVNKE